MGTPDPLNDERLDRAEIDFIKRVIVAVGKDVEDPKTFDYYLRGYIRMRALMRFAAPVTPVGEPN
jgi:hypothetical protein